MVQLRIEIRQMLGHAQAIHVLRNGWAQYEPPGKIIQLLIKRVGMANRIPLPGLHRGNNLQAIGMILHPLGIRLVICDHYAIAVHHRDPAAAGHMHLRQKLLHLCGVPRRQRLADEKFNQSAATHEIGLGARFITFPHRPRSINTNRPHRRADQQQTRQKQAAKKWTGKHAQTSPKSFLTPCSRELVRGLLPDRRKNAGKPAA